MTRPLRVFLCHASQDKPTVWRLHRYLKQHGVEPWLDREELLPGQDWAVEISKALDASDAILVCLSKASINKEGFVQKEISFALDKALEKPEGMIFIIPVKLQECELPRSLYRYHWVDLFREGGRKRLLMSLNRRATELGEDVSPVRTEDTKQRTPKPFKPEIKQEESIDLISSKDDAKEEPKQEMPPPLSLPKDEIKQENIVPEVKKEIEQEKPIINSAPIVEKKPFTKLLDPTSLAPNAITDSQGVKKPVSNDNFRWFYVGFLILLGACYIINLTATDLPTLTPSATLKPTTLTATKTYTPSPPKFTPTLQPTKTPAPIPTLGIGSTMISEKDGMVLVYVPAGEFTMGSNADPDEQPVHTVYLNAFWIDQTEVTNKQYKACMDTGTCEPPSDTSSLTHPNYYGNPDFDEYPIIYVDWNMAKTYCEWRDARLPTEAEWEKAARGTDTRTYPWGEGIGCEKANYTEKCVGDTTQVGNYVDGISPYEVYDMAGNVYEWVNDWYGEIYYQSSPYSNPSGPDSGQDKVLRGGGWGGLAAGTRLSSRFNYHTRTSTNFLGFRCALSP